MCLRTPSQSGGLAKNSAGVDAKSSPPKTWQTATHHQLSFGKEQLYRWALHRSPARLLMRSRWKDAEYLSPQPAPGRRIQGHAKRIPTIQSTTCRSAGSEPLCGSVISGVSHRRRSKRCAVLGTFDSKNRRPLERCGIDESAAHVRTKDSTDAHSASLPPKAARAAALVGNRCAGP
jgi:hypothetical protein